MNKIIDRETGLAAFRQGRSLCFRLDGRLDRGTARAIEGQLRNDFHATRLRLECSSLESADRAAIRSLASTILAWVQAREDRTIDVFNLDPELKRAVAWHPLRAVTDPGAPLFFDPDRDPSWDL
jgi:hypothetical protein